VKGNQAREESDSKTRLVAVMNHEVRTPLNSILGFTELLLNEGAGPLNEKQKRYAGNVEAAGRHLLALVNDSLDLSRIAAGKMDLEIVTLELAPLLDQAAGQIQPLVDSRGLEIRVDAGGRPWVKADRRRLLQVLWNLLSNAIRHTSAGGIITISARATELTAEILITDTGSGIAPDIVDKIFEPFFSTKEIGRGTGLGLSTVYGIVKQTGGYIFAESAEGNGTTMRVYLPRYIESAREVEQSKIERRPAEKPKDLTGRGTVLLVEDEDAVRSFAARALAQRGYHVLEATTGAEALDVFSNYDGEVDLVVSDVVMPEMDGPTLMAKLRLERPDLKIIFISGYAEDSFRRHLAENEDFMFLQKPFDLKELAAAVKAALQG